WDAYFTELRKALMAAWPATRARGWTERRRAARIRLVIDAEGLLRDFEILTTSGDPVVDHEVEQAIHQATQLPCPPSRVLHGKVELVTEWRMTVHPGLATKPGTTVIRPLAVGIAFDAVTLFDPRIDLTPLERNVTLSSYWVR
ncbi:MAG: TonB family protein, partial [Myxococcaceae bacterium]